MGESSVGVEDRMTFRLIVSCALISGSWAFPGSEFLSRVKRDDCQAIQTAHGECTQKAYADYQAEWAAGDDGLPDWLYRGLWQQVGGVRLRQPRRGGPYEGQPDGGQLAASQRQRPVLGLDQVPSSQVLPSEDGPPAYRDSSLREGEGGPQGMYSKGLHGLQGSVCKGGGWQAALGGKEDLQLPHKRHRCLRQWSPRRGVYDPREIGQAQG